MISVYGSELCNDQEADLLWLVRYERAGVCENPLQVVATKVGNRPVLYQCTHHICKQLLCGDEAGKRQVDCALASALKSALSVASSRLVCMSSL
jgi:hypothetical protein